MKKTNLILSEQRPLLLEMQNNAAIQKAITAWLVSQLDTQYTAQMMPAPNFRLRH